MKSLDIFTKRILSIALAISMVLCSASLFVFSIQSATASPDSKGVIEKNNYGVLEVPFAEIRGDRIYYLLLQNDENGGVMLRSEQLK